MVHQVKQSLMPESIGLAGTGSGSVAVFFVPTACRRGDAAVRADLRDLLRYDGPEQLKLLQAETVLDDTNSSHIEAEALGGVHVLGCAASGRRTAQHIR